MTVINIFTKVVQTPLHHSKLKSFVVKCKSLANWKQVSVLILYCYEDFEHKDMSVLPHEFTGKRSGARFMRAGKTILSGEMLIKSYLGKQRRLRSVLLAFAKTVLQFFGRNRMLLETTKESGKQLFNCRSLYSFSLFNDIYSFIQGKLTDTLFSVHV